jgi:hypothetical protein
VSAAHRFGRKVAPQFSVNVPLMPHGTQYRKQNSHPDFSQVAVVQRKICGGASGTRTPDLRIMILGPEANQNDTAATRIGGVRVDGLAVALVVAGNFS